MLFWSSVDSEEDQRFDFAGVICSVDSEFVILALPLTLAEKLGPIGDSLTKLTVAASDGDGDVEVLLFKIHKSELHVSRPTAWRKFIRFPVDSRFRPSVESLTELQYKARPSRCTAARKTPADVVCMCVHTW